MRCMRRRWPGWLLGFRVLLLGALAGACSPTKGDNETVSLPAFSFVPAWHGAGSQEDTRAEQLIRRSVWAVAAAPDRSAAASRRTVLGSAVAVSGETLLAGCDVAVGGQVIEVERRSARRPVRAVAKEPTGRLCELRPADIWLRTVPGYRPFDSVAVGEPVMAVVSRTSRSFDLVRGSVTGKGSADDPYLETSVMLPAGTRSAALFDRAGNLMGFGSAGPVGDAVVVAVPILPEAAPWLAQVTPRQTSVGNSSASGEQS
jgi:hypothetical protein